MSDRRRPIKIAIASRVAARIRELVAGGLDDLDLIEAVDAAFPDLSLHDYAGALALYRAEIGVPGYVLIPRAVQ